MPLSGTAPAATHGSHSVRRYRGGGRIRGTRHSSRGHGPLAGRGLGSGWGGAFGRTGVGRQVGRGGGGRGGAAEAGPRRGRGSAPAEALGAAQHTDGCPRSNGTPESSAWASAQACRRRALQVQPHLQHRQHHRRRQRRPHAEERLQASLGVGRKQPARVRRCQLRVRGWNVGEVPRGWVGAWVCGWVGRRRSVKMMRQTRGGRTSSASHRSPANFTQRRTRGGHSSAPRWGRMQRGGLAQGGPASMGPRPLLPLLQPPPESLPAPPARPCT
jgi:hypothetical protein